MPTAIPFDAKYDLTHVKAISLSPTGDRLAIVAKEYDREAGEARRSLFVAPTDGASDPHRLTRIADAGGPRWSPDGAKFGFLAARPEDLSLSVASQRSERSRRETATDSSGSAVNEDVATENEKADPPIGIDEENPEPQVWVYDLERGGDARQVTTRGTGVRDFDWGPSGERVVISARDPTADERASLARRENGGPIVTERLQHKLQGRGWLDTVTTYLFVLDLETGERTRLDEAYGGGMVAPRSGLQPRWGSTRIAFLSNRTDRPEDTYAIDVYTIRPDGTDLARLTDGSFLALCPTWSPDGDRLAFVGRDPENYCVPAGIALGDVTAGECLSLAADLDRPLTPASTVRWLDADTLVAPFLDEAVTRLGRVRATSGTHEWVFDRLEPNRTITGFDCRGGTIALVLSRPGQSADVYTMPAESLDAGPADLDPLTRVSTTNVEFHETHPMPDCRRIGFESDGHDLDGLVYLPPDFDPTRPEARPVLVSIHGGHVDCEVPEFDFENAAWTSRGYVVFCPNYRGSASYGREFAETLFGEWGTDEVEDVVAGVEALVDRGWVDPDRVFGTGFSYGATAQAHIAAQTDLFTAAAPDHGIYNLRADFGASDWHVGYTDMLGLPWENREAYDAASSLPDVDEMETPLLVLAGGEDLRCPLTQAEQLYVSVKKRGIPARLVVYPDEGHGIGGPTEAIHRLEQLEDWFERHDPAID